MSPITEDYTIPIIYRTADGREISRTVINGTLSNGSATLSANTANDAIQQNLPAGYDYVSGLLTADLLISSSTNDPIYVIVVAQTNPDNPDQTDQPDHPVNPDQPGQPDQPNNPGHNQDHGQNGEQTQANSTTTQTTATATQQQADNGQQRLPQTGNDQSATSLLAIASLGLAGMLGLSGLRKKHE